VPAECTLVIRDGDIVGRVTSAASSPACGRVIGLAYVHPDDAEPGRGIQIKLEDGALLEAKVESLPFYDPDNQRQEL
jgi:sarcosine oxidase subunit alpha